MYLVVLLALSTIWLVFRRKKSRKAEYEHLHYYTCYAELENSLPALFLIFKELDAVLGRFLYLVRIRVLENEEIRSVRNLEQSFIKLLLQVRNYGAAFPNLSEGQECLKNLLPALNRLRPLCLRLEGMDLESVMLKIADVVEFESRLGGTSREYSSAD